MSDETKSKLKSIATFAAGIAIGGIIVYAFNRRKSFTNKAIIDLLDTQSTGPRLHVNLLRKNGKYLSMAFGPQDTIKIVNDLFEKLYPGD